MGDETPPPLPSQSAPVPPASRMEPLAVVSLVLAILSWIMCLLFGSVPAIILGHLSRSRIRRSNGALHGMNFAVAGLIIAYLNVPMGILGGIMLADMIRSDRARVHDLDVQKKEIVSDDGKSKITVSGHWVKRTDLNAKASLQASYKDKEMYVMVISEAKSTLPKMTLDHHHELTGENMLKKMTNSSGTPKVSITIDDHPALQDELTGIENGVNITFLHTTIDSGDAYHQILAWTLKSRWERENAELRDVTDSFHSGE